LGSGRPTTSCLPTTETRGLFRVAEHRSSERRFARTFRGRWDSPPIFPHDWTKEDVAIQFVDAQRAALGELFGNDPYLLKDPRISILLPLWRQITNDKDCAVVIVRDPLEVAASLTRRDELRTLTGLALWATYNRRCCATFKGRAYTCATTPISLRILLRFSPISLRASEPGAKGRGP